MCRSKSKTVFEAHSSRPQAPAKGVSQVVHPDTLEAHRTFSLQRLHVPPCRSSAPCPPSLVVHPAHAVSLAVAVLVREYVRPMLTANLLDHRLSHIVQHQYSGLAVLRYEPGSTNTVRWNDGVSSSGTRCPHRHFRPQISSRLAPVLTAKKRHTLQMPGQLRKQQRLLVPAE